MHTIFSTEIQLNPYLLLQRYSHKIGKKKKKEPGDVDLLRSYHNLQMQSLEGRLTLF